MARGVRSLSLCIRDCLRIDWEFFLMLIIGLTPRESDKISLGGILASFALNVKVFGFWWETTFILSFRLLGRGACLLQPLDSSLRAPPSV